MKLKNLIKTATLMLSKHEGTILTVTAIGSTLAAVYFAAKDSPKLMAKLDELNEEGATNFEKAKAVAPIVARTVIATGLSVGCTIGMHKYASDAIQSLSGALQVATIAKDEYKKKTEEIYGEGAAKKVESEIAFDKSAKAYGSGPIEHIVDTGHGKNLFYDEWSGISFYSDINYIKKAINDLNYQLMHDMSISESEYYDALDIPSAKVGARASNNGWNVDDGQIEVEFYAKLDDSDQAYTVLSLRTPPKPKYFRANW